MVGQTCFIEEKKVKEESSTSILLMSGKELLSEVKKEHEMQFILVRKPKVILTSTYMEDFPEEIQELLENFVDILVDEWSSSLPPIRSIIHHNDFILGAILLNKETYRLTPQENEKVKRKF